MLVFTGNGLATSRQSLLGSFVAAETTPSKARSRYTATCVYTQVTCRLTWVQVHVVELQLRLHL